jgi:hypothetical protein
MEVRVDDESNVLDAVAVGLELHIDWPVNDLVVGVKEFVAAPDPRFVQEEAGRVTNRESEDFTRLTPQWTRIWESDIREMEGNHVLQRRTRSQVLEAALGP